jgi:AcrR family transcriptional regulator
MDMGRPAKFDNARILDAAGAIVSAQGVGGATITAIAAAIGAPNGSIYHRFRSRDELLGRLWLQKAMRFQDSFVEAMADPDPWTAGLKAALSLPRSTRHDLAGARILLLHRREDFLSEGWPAEMRMEAERLGLQVRDALDHITRRLFGRLGLAGRRTASFAVLDVSFAAVRRYVVANEVPPAQVDELVRAAYKAVIPRATRGTR